MAHTTCGAAVIAKLADLAITVSAPLFGAGNSGVVARERRPVPSDV